MPMYEYRCPKCDTRFERLLRLSERDDPQPCPNEKCDEKETQKMISRTSFSLKGGGWASDGYSG
jgi:putative FmdB family regulatory protein